MLRFLLLPAFYTIFASVNAGPQRRRIRTAGPDPPRCAAGLPPMNTIDLVVYLVLALALFEGWRRGAILQICSLAGLVAGIWLAARYGAAVGTWLGIDPAASAA